MTAFLLADAAQVVSDRQSKYGYGRGSMTDIAKLWSVMLDTPVDARTACLMMIALKLIRDMHTHQRDNLIDIAGYAEMADRCTPPADHRPEANPLAKSTAFAGSTAPVDTSVK